MTRSMGVAALCAMLIGGAASAAPVTYGSYTFDTSAFADTASSAAGSVAGVANVVDQNLTTVGSIAGIDVLRFGFTDNMVFNGSGDDLIVFERTAIENQTMSLTFAGTTLTGIFREEFQLGGGRVSVFGYDLSALGVATNAKILSDFFLRPSGGNSPDVSGIVALYTTPVPVPATLPLLVAGLGALGFMRRRSRRS